MNYESTCKKVIDIALQTSEFISGEARKFSLESVEVKGLHNFVSYVDKGAEERIVNGLSKLIPEAGFIAEEGTRGYNNEQLKWVIDPLDGTTNFIHGLPVYSISIALMDGDNTVLGVVHEVNLKETFYAWKDSKAFLNERPIRVSNASSVKDSLIATGFPYYDFHKMHAYLESLEFLLKNSHGARRLGSAAADLAYVACGRFEAFYEYSLKPWDVAAGAFIVEQAGGKISDFSGGKNYIFGEELIASNSLIFDEFFAIVSKYLNKM